MSLLNTFVVIGLNTEFTVPFHQSAKTEMCVTRVDMLDLVELPLHPLLTGASNDGHSVCVVPMPLVNTEEQVSAIDASEATSLSRLEAAISVQHPPSGQLHREKNPISELQTKILEINSQYADNWLRQFASLISPRSWEKL